MNPKPYFSLNSPETIRYNAAACSYNAALRIVTGGASDAMRCLLSELENECGKLSFAVMCSERGWTMHEPVSGQ